ncbi:MAG: hypothetical protein LBI63_01095, partial [Candidatus Ancillula sp.]|nr:hypothetical protein [Candidatus Ancillula sp.]
GIEASKHTPEYDQAYDGDNGCSKTGETSFYDGLNVDASRSGEVGQLSIKIKEIAMNDVSFAPKLGQWSACVKTKGFDFEVPPGSKISKTDVLDKGNPVYGVNNELIAAADAECKQQVGFIEEWHKVLDTVEERELKNNLPIFEAEKAYTDSMINRANEIIEKYGNEFK